MFKGIITALLTPFIDSKLDLESFRKLVEFQINQGIHGLFLLGSTGESATITFEERDLLIKETKKILEKLNSNIPLIVGAFSNSTETVVEYVKQAEGLGADALLLICPYGNKPTQEGLYQHFKHIANKTKLPVILYNIPGRAVINMSDETTAKLTNECKNIIGIKDSTADLTRPVKLRKLIDREDFIQLSGEDESAVAFNLHGGVGCISVASNIIPKELAEMQNLSLKGNFSEAMKIFNKYFKLLGDMFLETNPIPVKYAAYKMGIIKSPELRLPLTTLSSDNQDKLDLELKKLGLIK